MILGKLLHDDLEFLVKKLKINKGMDEHEYRELKVNHPYAVMRPDNALILSNMVHYGKHDLELNQFLLEKFGRSEFVIDFFYELIYSEGDYTNPHYDKKVVAQTTLVMLEDNFTGGELVIDGKKVDFHTTGQYVNFQGNEQKHEVKEVISGQRRVLVVMFNKNSII